MFRLARFLPCPPIRFLFPPDGNVCPILSLFVVLLALSPEGKANHLAVHRHYKPHWSCKWLLQQSLLVRIWLATLSPWVFFCCPTINLCLFLRESSKLFAVINGIIVYCEGQHTALSLNLHCSVHIQGVPWTTFLLCGCFDVEYIYGFVGWGVCMQSRWRHSVPHTRWRICVTMATLWQQEDGCYMLLWKRHGNNKMAAMRYYGDVILMT